MPERTVRMGTVRGSRQWAVLLVLLLGVLVPTACVLWFMNAAMRNISLAARQKLTEVYRERLLSAGKDLEEYWSKKIAALNTASEDPAPEAFAALVRSGVADTIIVYEGTGAVMYPQVNERAVPIKPKDPPAWGKARELEFKLDQPDMAAEMYGKIAQAAGDINIKARSLVARARCLIRSEQEPLALKVLTGPLAEPEYRTSTYAHGRWIAPNAQLLALQLITDPKSPEFTAVLEDLVQRLNDYNTPAMPSPQRRFLMRTVQEMAPEAPRFPTLQAEGLAADYLETKQPTAEPSHLSRTGKGRLWHIASDDKGLIAIFREDNLAKEMAATGDLNGPFAGATLSVAISGTTSSGEQAFLSVPAPKQLPGWELQVHFVGEDPFAAASARQRATYLWTGTVGISIIALLTLIVARYITRQMKLTRLKNDLIATVSHELKTPLSSMRVLVDTLLEGRYHDQKQAREYFQLIAKENERLTRLIDNFLTFSRMERNKRAFEFAELKVDEVVTAAVDSALDRFSQPGCRLDVEIAEDLPAIIGDRDALITVILNLLDNAYKYSKDEKHVFVHAYARDGNIHLEVRDDGIGLSRRAVKKIFDRFYQVDRSLSRGISGCGLGLSIVKFIIDAHGGSIDVRSQLGEGSTFTVKLPTGPAPATDKLQTG